jgi:periplasmic copper chaperone A
MPRMTTALRMVGVALLAALALAGCASAKAKPSIAVASAYVPQPTTPGTTVAYLDIRNNGSADRLVGVHTSVGGKVQLLAPGARQGSTLTMHAVPAIPLPANSMTLLNPDSYHLLITGAGPMHDGKDIMLRLTFANSVPVTAIAMVTNVESGGSSYFLN